MFCDYVKKEFKNLIQKYNFIITECNKQIIALNNKKVELRILYDNKYSYEISCYLKHNMIENSFDIHSILRYKQIKNYYASHICQAVSEQEQIYCLHNYLSLLENYCTEFLKGDKNAYIKLNDFVLNESKNIYNEKEVLHIKNLMQNAWKNHDFETFVSLSMQIKDRLTKSELSKYTFAKKQLGASS